MIKRARSPLHPLRLALRSLVDVAALRSLVHVAALRSLVHVAAIVLAMSRVRARSARGIASRRGSIAIPALLLFAGAAWSCRQSSERTQPPMSTLNGATTDLRVIAANPDAPAVSANRVSAAANDASASVSGRPVTNGAAANDALAANDRRPLLDAADARVSVANDASAAAGASAQKPRLRVALEEKTWTFQDPTLGRIDVVAVLPDRFADERFPMLVALHGRGEAMKGPERGARGWVDDYAMLRAMQRLSNPPLKAADFENIVNSKRLERLNHALEKEPYRGLVVLCPYTPDLLSGDKPFEYVRPYARFLVDVLLPRARRELPVIGTPETTGIDGVSLGGRVGFLSGLMAAEQFHTVAGLQAAFDSDDAVALGRLGDDAVRRNRGIRFRLLTSERDYFIEANQSIAAEFERRRLPMKLLLVPGPHDYVFNRGPGSIEMLFFHDRALRRAAWPE